MAKKGSAPQAAQPPALSRRLAKAVNSPTFQSLPPQQQQQVRKEMQHAQTFNDLSPKAQSVVRQSEADAKK
jgi:TRAP-type C4-dicarboxylate transport system substrate-binding protein